MAACLPSCPRPPSHGTNLPAQGSSPGFVVLLARRFDLALLDLDLGDVRLRYWQRHVLARLDHVELARKQHDEAARVADAAGDPGGIIASPPIKVGPRRPDDRRAGVLR